MKGPEKSNYEQGWTVKFLIIIGKLMINSLLFLGTFVLCVKFSPKYPSVPPEIRFLTKVYKGVCKASVCGTPHFLAGELELGGSCGHHDRQLSYPVIMLLFIFADTPLQCQ